MKIKEYSLEVTIGLPEFTNIKPNITFTDVDSFEEAHAEATKYLNSIWKNTPNAKIDSPFGQAKEGDLPSTGSDFKKVTSFTGEELFWDEVHHKGLSLDGKQLFGGSTYAAKLVPFDRVNIIKNCAKAWGVTEQEVDKIWSNSSASELGTGIHSALEHYFLYKELGAKIHAVKKDSKYNAALPSNDFLREIVLNFEKDFPLTNKIIPEALVSDVKRERCGWIDFLEIVDEKKKICIINDFKSGGMTDKDVLKAQHQMSFYADILAKFGWTTQELRGFYLQGTHFKKVAMKVLPVKE